MFWLAGRAGLQHVLHGAPHVWPPPDGLQVHQKLISTRMAHALVSVYGDLLTLADRGDCGPAMGTR